MKTIVFIQSTLALIWKKPLTFKVTPKFVDRSVYREERRALRLYMGIFGFIAGTLIFGMIHLLTRDNSILRLGIASFLIAYFWTAYNAILIFVGIQEILRKHHERKQYRFPVELEGEVYSERWLNLLAKVKLKNLSVSGVNFVTEKPFTKKEKLLLHFNTPSNESILLPIDAIHRQNKVSHNSVDIGASFAQIEATQRERLFSYLFIELPDNRKVQSDRQKDSPQSVENKLSLMQRIPLQLIGNPVFEPVYSENDKRA